MRGTPATLSFVAVLLLCGVLCAIWFFAAHDPVSLRKVRQLRPGLATTNGIVRLLGPPQQVYIYSDEIRWSYYRPNGFRNVYLVFSTNWVYSHFELDD